MPLQFEVLEYEQFEGEFRRYFKFLNWFGEGDRFAKLYSRLCDPELKLALLPEGVPIGEEINEELEPLESYDTSQTEFGALIMASNREVVPVIEELLQRLESPEPSDAYETAGSESRS